MGASVSRALTRSNSTYRIKLVTAADKPLAESSKLLNSTTAMDSTDHSNNSTVSRADMASTIGSSPGPNVNLGGRESKGLTSVCASESAASTSHSSPHQTQDPRVSNQGERKDAQGLGFLAKGFSIFSTVLSYFLKFCGGGYTPYVKQAEKDIDKVADFVEEGAKLVVKLADEIEAMAHVAELTAQEAEDLALKVEAKTKIVKQTLDAIADVLEGDKKLSTVLTDYATQKKEAAATEQPNVS